MTCESLQRAAKGLEYRWFESERSDSMSGSAFTTVRTAHTANEAGQMITALRAAGFHPLDLSMSAPFCLPGAETSFPVQVAAEEALAAEGLLDACDRAKDSRD